MINKLIALCLLPSAVCLPVNAQIASQWIPVAKGVQGEIFSIDKNSIQPSGSAYGFWVHIDHTQGNISATRMYMAADCGTDAIQYAWIIEANQSGHVTKNEQLNMPAMQTQSGTVNSQLVNAVCTGFSTDPQLAALTRARQSSADAITKAMQSAANMYK
ncbi:MAG: surface-adhesin E family protein [Nostoc sp.]|uniref:surface-adhesin E family protein n=1 Tax=Nostoc sp. TaxID=1180 RepID=UPI002FEF5425